MKKRPLNRKLKSTGIRWVLSVCIFFLAINLVFSIGNHLQQRRIRHSTLKLIENISHNPIYVESTELEKILNSQQTFESLWTKTLISQAVIGVVVALVVLSVQVLINTMYEGRVNDRTDGLLESIQSEFGEIKDQVQHSISLVCSQEPPVWRAGDGEGIDRRVRALNSLGALRKYDITYVEYYIMQMSRSLIKDIASISYQELSQIGTLNKKKLEEFQFNVDPFRLQLSSLSDESIRRLVLAQFGDIWNKSVERMRSKDRGAHWIRKQKEISDAGGDIDQLLEKARNSIQVGLADALGLLARYA